MNPVQRVMLDTTVLIDLGRNRRTVVDWLDDGLARQADVSVSTVAVARFFAGEGARAAALARLCRDAERVGNDP